MTDALQNASVIASQSADWRGNPFSLQEGVRIPTPVTSVTGSE
jgi:hypothetical protein